MAKNLLIVESPAKSKTLKKFLGKNFDVMATVGHIIDLPKSKIGVELDGKFTPDYVVIEGKEKVISELKKAAKKADAVFLAPDPDREGEAIAWHVANQFRKARVKSDIKRIAFNAITRKAVTEAFDHARDIDINLVNAQQARRILDRIVGYKVSPFLWQTIARGLSAGRVQSVALRIICEREQAVRDFTPEEYWDIEAEFIGKKKKAFIARLAKIDNKKPELPDEKTVSGIIDDLKKQSFVVSDVKIGSKKRNPLPPFTTSTLQQEASSKLNFHPEKTMRIAQALYEGIDLKTGEGAVGLITYMRTDSVRVEPDAVNEARSVIQKSYGKKYVPEKPNFYRSKKSAQDAHEAIRPTYLDHPPDKLKKALTRDQLRLYTLIWERFIASQMTPAEFATIAVDVTGGKYLFRASSQKLTFDGFLKVYQESRENGENGNGSKTGEIPDLVKDEELKARKFDPNQHFTKPPPRFSEATLVKELEADGIGRPSTYAQIISTLKRRKYVELLERRLVPTELGFAVTKLLVENLENLFNVSFTAEMEKELDDVEDGKIDYIEVLNDFYNPFATTMKSLSGKAKKIKESLVEETDEACELCGRPMVIRWGRNGRFMACSGYPECKNTKPLTEDEQAMATDETCDECGSPMVVKEGRFGKFLGCSRYPECKFTKSFTTGVDCPKKGCNGDIVERKSRRGRTFYGCTNYPKCDFVSWYKPVNMRCEKCGNSYLVEKETKAKGFHYACPECKAITYPQETPQSVPN